MMMWAQERRVEEVMREEGRASRGEWKGGVVCLVLVRTRVLVGKGVVVQVSWWVVVCPVGLRVSKGGGGWGRGET